MATGKPRDWTIEELQAIWGHDGSDGTTPTQICRDWGIASSTWYTMKSRLREAGGPEKLWEQMEHDKQFRYNSASAPPARAGTKRMETLAEQLAKTYAIRVGAAGRGGSQAQYTVTIPPRIAQPFVEKYGYSVRYEPVEGGILIKPVEFVAPTSLPEWLLEIEMSGGDAE